MEVGMRSEIEASASSGVCLNLKVSRAVGFAGVTVFDLVFEVVTGVIIFLTWLC